jgi:hypothetical protein
MFLFLRFTTPSRKQQTDTSKAKTTHTIHHGPHPHNYRSYHHYRPQAQSLVAPDWQEDLKRPCHRVHLQKPHHWYYHHHQEDHNTPQRRRSPWSRRQGPSGFKEHCDP